MLNRYQEPSWNNPVVRIINARGENLIRRIAGDYSKEKVAQEIIFILENQKVIISNDLRELAKGLRY